MTPSPFSLAHLDDADLEARAASLGITVPQLEHAAWQLEQKILERPEAPDACWTWSGRRGGNAYGLIDVGQDITRGAHRLAYAIAIGPIPPGHHALHRCDRPECIRPLHLFTGTHLENMADASRKGRLRGRVLSDEDVVCIRRMVVRFMRAGRSRVEAQEVTARACSVSVHHVNDIIGGRARAAA